MRKVNVPYDSTYVKVGVGSRGVIRVMSMAEVAQKTTAAHYTYAAKAQLRQLMPIWKNSAKNFSVSSQWYTLQFSVQRHKERIHLE